MNKEEFLKSDFINTKWDARSWTPEMKLRWQEKAFELGAFWSGGFTDWIDDSFYYVYENGAITHSDDEDHFEGHPHGERSYYSVFPEIEQDKINTATPTASGLLSQGAEILNQRGAEYEKDGNQERSFDSVATAFNAITGKDLTAAEVALLLQCVKDVRQWSQDRLHEDSVIDGINYAALKGELLHKQYKG